MLNAAFVVDGHRVEAFDTATADAAAEHESRITFRNTGPLPLFSFAAFEGEAASG